jgi:nucleotide-binding universal stress UspA family protein
VLLHVVEAPTLVVPDMAGATTWDQLLQAQVDSGRCILETAEQQARAAGVDCEAVLHESDPRRVADVIVEYIGKYRCDLVVMGTHGRRGMRRLLLGSDAELVLRQSPVPTMLVREPDKAH